VKPCRTRGAGRRDSGARISLIRSFLFLMEILLSRSDFCSGVVPPPLISVKTEHRDGALNGKNLDLRETSLVSEEWVFARPVQETIAWHYFVSLILRTASFFKLQHFPEGSLRLFSLSSG